MTRDQLRDLLERAAQATREYANAIDSHLYKLGSSYDNAKEQATSDLADELAQAAVYFSRPVRDILDDVIKLVEQVTRDGVHADQKTWDAWNERFRALPDESRINCWKRCTDGGIDTIDLCKRVHANWAKMVLEPFGLPTIDLPELKPTTPTTPEEAEEELYKLRHR